MQRGPTAFISAEYGKGLYKSILQTLAESIWEVKLENNAERMPLQNEMKEAPTLLCKDSWNEEISWAIKDDSPILMLKIILEIYI